MAMSAANATDEGSCPTCGSANGCGMAKGEATCWCFALPHVLSVSQENDRGRCYCHTCLERAVDERGKCGVDKRDGVGWCA
jgi:Cysteine-rich CWC